MEQQRKPSERIRRILQTMERSIDTARDRRLNRNRPSTTPAAPQPRLASPKPIQRETPVNQSNNSSDDAARIKARPKRPNSGFFREWNDQGMRSKAS